MHARSAAGSDRSEFFSRDDNDVTLITVHGACICIIYMHDSMHVTALNHQWLAASEPLLAVAERLSRTIVARRRRDSMMMNATSDHRIISAELSCIINIRAELVSDIMSGPVTGRRVAGPQLDSIIALAFSEGFGSSVAAESAESRTPAADGLRGRAATAGRLARIYAGGGAAPRRSALNDN